MGHLNTFLDKHWRILFILSAIFFTFSTFVEPYPFSSLFKVLPLIILILFSLLNSQSNIPNLFMVGLFFSMSGDFILNIENQKAFIYGLGAFFIAHLFYIASMGSWNLKRTTVLPLLIIFSIGGISLFLIYPNLGQLFVPVIAYMAILLVMSLSTVYSIKSNFWLMLGGISFLISDSIIGLNKFYTPIGYSHFLIMSSYYFAQYSLLNGFINSKEILDEQPSNKWN